MARSPDPRKAKYTNLTAAQRRDQRIHKGDVNALGC
jgi:hypothetical protein